MPDTSAPASRPIRIALAADSEEAREELAWRLRRYGARVLVVPADDPGVDLVLVDPYADGGGFSADRFDAALVDDHRIVIYSAAPEIDELVFGLARAVVGGERLRGWISADLRPRDLVGCLEMVHAGTIVVHGGARGHRLTA